MEETNRLYQKLVGITEVYLGPAADRFIARQVRNHLRKEPAQLRRHDLAQLLDWIRIAMGYITEDSRLIEQYMNELRKVIHGEEHESCRK